MKLFLNLLVLALAAATSTPSWASATVVSSLTGVSASGARLAVGTSVDGRTRVVVAKGKPGQVTVLRYDNGCVVSLQPGQVYTVIDVAPCAPAEPAAPLTDPNAAGPIGGIGATAVVGVVTVGAIVGGVIAATSGNNANNIPVFISH